MTVLEGRELNVAVVTNDDTGIALAGALPYVWTSSDDTVLRIGEVGTIGTPDSGVEHNDDEIRVIAIAAGSATLTVANGEMSKSIEVTIDAEEMTP